MKKRLFSMLLAALMIVATIPVTAFATDDEMLRHPVYCCASCGTVLVMRTKKEIDANNKMPCTHGSGIDYPAKLIERWYCPECGELMLTNVAATGIYCTSVSDYIWY